MRLLFLLVCCATITVHAAAQLRADSDKKISPKLIELKNTLKSAKQQNFFVVTSDINAFKQLLLHKNLNQSIVSEYEASGLFVLKLNWPLIDSILLPSSLVKFVDIVRTPKEETVIDGFDPGTNNINLVHDRFKLINGSGSVVSVKENRPDTNDIDLRGRLVSTTTSSPILSSHATIMSTIIAGAGNSDYTARGVAWGANISSSNFASLLPDSDAEYKKNSTSVQNHSYGTGIENYYGADASAYDASTISNPTLLHVFSAGNSGDKISSTGAYTGIPVYANLTGSFKMAKNIVVVGSIDSFYNISSLSSRGPTYDGRIRPELVAFGMDGSSGAAAIVSGTALLLQQAYGDQNSGQLPAAALVKSILLNSADDVGGKGIDYQSGYGSLNAYRAVEGMVNKRYFSGSLSAGQSQRFTLNLPSNIHQLKITLCWSDPPANTNDSKSLINDLDLRLIHASSGSVWLPWMLNHFSHPDSLGQPANRKRDSINNTEQITLDDPQPGAYEAEVSAYHISQGSQSYYISYQWDTINQFKWQYPTANDPVPGGRSNTLRWASTFNATMGQLYYSLDVGRTWTLLADGLDLGKKYFQWTAPDIFSPVMFRMVINGGDFISDTAIISSRLGTGVGFNCIDSFLIYWNKNANASSYTLYQLGSKYLEPLKSLTDTGIILNKSINAALHYSVAPVINGKSGIKSYTFNYNTQGVACYIKGFIADLVNDAANIRLELGTTYNIQELSIEKWSGGSFVSIQTIRTGLSSQHNYADNSLLKGGNIYRARINLKNGQTVYSDSETIYYLPEMDYLVYPNPTNRNFKIVSKNIDNAELVIYSAVGQKVMVKKLQSTVEEIPIFQLRKGLYFIFIRQKDLKDYRTGIVIQ